MNSRLEKFVGDSIECRQSRVFSQLVLAVVCCGHPACVWSWGGSAAQNHFHLNISVVLKANQRCYSLHWRQHQKPWPLGDCLCVCMLCSYVFALMHVSDCGCMPKLLNVIHCHLSSGLLPKTISHAVRTMVRKCAKSSVSADKWVCFELQTPFRALCPYDQWFLSQRFLPTTNSSVDRIIGKECGRLLIKCLWWCFPCSLCLRACRIWWTELIGLFMYMWTYKKTHVFFIVSSTWSKREILLNS